MFQKNDRVVATRAFTGYTAEGYRVAAKEEDGTYTFHNEFNGRNGHGNARGDIREGTPGVVTSVRSPNSYSIKFEGVENVVRVSIDLLAPLDPALQAQQQAEREAREKAVREEAERVAEAARVAREAKVASMQPKPGDIMPDDARIQWLWRQIADKAETASWCSTFDDITDEFHIPGREREFKVEFEVDDIVTNARVKTLSNTDAAKKIKTAFPKAKHIKVNNKPVTVRI